MSDMRLNANRKSTEDRMFAPAAALSQCEPVKIRFVRANGLQPAPGMYLFATRFFQANFHTAVILHRHWSGRKTRLAFWWESR